MIGFTVDVEFVWGFQAKVVGYSKTSPSFYYPPPTTILGALAEYVAKEYALGEHKGKEIIPKLAQNLLALGIRPLNCIPLKFSDINKLIAIRLTGGTKYPTPSDPYGSFDAPAMGKTILASLNEKPPQLRIYIVLENDRIDIDDRDEIMLDKQVLWGVHRLGSKESVVSVLTVSDFQPDVKNGRINTTSYSFPLIDGVKLVSELQPKWVLETLVNPFKIKAYNENDNPLRNYLAGQNIVKYYLPIMMGPDDSPLYMLELSHNLCIYELNEDEKVIGLCPNRKP
ncbi:MAG: type I-A CRISPR-associated protein Cas5a [Aigarchaeota archaeon]|nr:type I-A CRISPR-associated protein Cas5a [Candidatus Pelearchaeum maunauluense]